MREDQCWALLGNRPIGRLAVIGADGGPDIFPVNTLVHDGKIYFRSGGGAKMREVAADDRVAFEMDGAEPPWRWSVVIRGTARRLDRDDEIEASGVLGLATLSPSPKNDFCVVTPVQVSGRRFRTDFPEPAERSEVYGRGSDL
ncbi:pyridoxamine 5'-phosphate oxidase family protein [Microbacterium thalassium]|uniref:pyridoxamine 5'-phosphate oxidase family protein n=1 Tax=Microbacterium thalassium TaxID=362649 RepID=UPI0031D2E2EF